LEENFIVKSIQKKRPSRGKHSGAWKKCAAEWGKCKFRGHAVVRYGKRGKYAFKTARNGISCTNSVFGDPNNGVVKECHYIPLHQRFRFCANEHGTCKTKGLSLIKYGQNRKYTYKIVNGTTACSNSVFGDPIVGTVKKCWVINLQPRRRRKWRRWTVGGNTRKYEERTQGQRSGSGSSGSGSGSSGSGSGSSSSGSGSSGSGSGSSGSGSGSSGSGSGSSGSGSGSSGSGSGSSGSGSGSSQSTSGSGKIIPIKKNYRTRESGGSHGGSRGHGGRRGHGGNGWNFCSNEWGQCRFRGHAVVRYGKRGKYVYKTARNGISCTNGVFGDPNYGIVKACHYINLHQRFRFCSNEHQTCHTKGKSLIKYGEKRKYTYKIVNGTTPCSNSVFGDPIVGTVKKCWVINLQPRRKKWRRWTVGGNKNTYEEKGSGQKRPHRKPHGRSHRKPHGRSHRRPHKRPHGRSHRRPHKRPHGRSHRRPHRKPHGRSHRRPHRKPHGRSHRRPHKRPHGRTHRRPHGRPHRKPHKRPHRTSQGRPHRRPHGRPHRRPHKRPHRTPQGRPHRRPHGRPHRRPHHAGGSGNWVRCADEWKQCSFNGRAIVRYGKNGRYAYKVANNGISCTNGVFGDPNYGVFKECHYINLHQRFRYCSNEYQTCHTRGKSLIKYGEKGRYTYKVVNGTTPCSNSVFGDPIVGTVKKCWVINLGGGRKRWRRWTVGGNGPKYQVKTRHHRRVHRGSGHRGTPRRHHRRVHRWSGYRGTPKRHHRKVHRWSGYRRVHHRAARHHGGGGDQRCLGYVGKKVHIIADSGKLLARCNGCGPGSYPDSVTVHANRGDAWAQWVVESRGNKCALRSDTGRYAARCNGCWRGGAYPDSVFNHAGTASLGQSWTVWDMKRFGHKVAFRADTGRYMARCNGCVPGGAYPDAAFVHARNPPSEPWALWTIEIAGAARSGGQHRRHRRRGHWRRSHHVVRRHFRRRCVVRGRHRYCFNMRNNKK